jgi:hypothetical protein
MRVCVYQPEDRQYACFQGPGRVDLPSPEVLVRSRYGSVPLNVLPIEATGNFQRTGVSDVPQGVIVSNWLPGEKEETDPFDDFLWIGVRSFFFYSIFRWVWNKL